MVHLVLFFREYWTPFQKNSMTKSLQTNWLQNKIMYSSADAPYFHIAQS